DVDLESGNIRFIGDLEITGSVQDGMTAEAKGTLTVRRNVYAARIAAGESINVMHNIISSDVSAGRQDMIGAQLSRMAASIGRQMKQMIEVLRQLASVPAFEQSLARTGLGPLVKALCEGRFKELPASIGMLQRELAKGDGMLGEEWKQFALQ